MRLAYEAPCSHIWWAPRRVIHMGEVCSIHWSHKIVFPSVHTNMRERERERERGLHAANADSMCTTDFMQ